MNKILAIARLTVKGELRNKVIYILMAMAFLFFFMARGAPREKLISKRVF